MSISDFEIDKYFDGDLTDAQKIAFEEKMQSDALFAREVREHKQLRRDLFTQGERISLIDQMDEIHHKEYGGIPYLKEGKSMADTDEETQEEVKTKPEDPAQVKKAPQPPKQGGNKVISLKMFYMGIGIAASLAAIITLGGVWLTNNTQIGDVLADAGYDELVMKEDSAPEKDTFGSRGNTHIDKVNPTPYKGDKYVATAFAIAKDGYFITNNHVVKGSKKLTLKLIDESNNWTEYKAEVVLNDESSDLAMVKITDTNFREMGILPFTFSEKSAMIGEEIFTLGYPKRDIVMEPGIISSTSGLDGDTTAYQVAMSLNRGNSGGPIFNSKGEVVAVVKGKHNGKEGTGYVVKSDYLWNLIKKYESENDVTIKRPKWNQLKGKRPLRMIKHIRQFVFLVEAEK